MLYCQPHFVRGSGLGNRLFPWARCLLFSRNHKVPMLQPYWSHFFRVGPLLRGGIDLRAYSTQILLLNLFNRGQGDIAGLQRLRLKHTATRIPEPDDLSQLPEPV